jgi:hypothetical protein
MPKVQFQHPKTKRIHTIDANPKSEAHLLSKGFKFLGPVAETSEQPAEVPVVVGESVPETAAPAKVDIASLSRSELFAKAKELKLTVKATMATDALREAVAKALNQE